MSGHSKWSTIKRKKGAADAKRGRIFARLVRAIEVAAREGGGDPDYNPTLADAIQGAKDNSVPKDTIERAVKRGSGELEGVSYEPVQYEGYAGGGVAVLVDCLTDNRNRTAADVRAIFTKHGGSLAEPGSVAYLFDRRGMVVVGSDGVTEDDVLVAGLDAGLEDIEDQGDQFIAWCDPSDVRGLRGALQDKGLPVKEAVSTMVPASTVPITDVQQAKKLMRLLDAIDDNDDVQEFYANYDVADELMEQLAEE
ncbi:MAG: YebC/PmpR family DNA-binding transcriptional regulator [Actinobacteria bacterium]|nr:YebC/PmpR family DNA-binding transcriptional regulator [Actinomycetota bacterium]